MAPAEVVGQEIVSQIVSIPVACASYHYASSGPELAAGSAGSIFKESNKKNAIITGDSHGNELTTIQQLVLKGIIVLEKETDWDVLSRLTQSTILDQLRIADNILEHLKQKQAKYLQKKQEGREVLEKLLSQGISTSVDEQAIAEMQALLAKADEDILYGAYRNAQQVQLIGRLCEEARVEKQLFKNSVDNIRVIDPTWHGDLGDGVCDRHNNDWKRLYFNKIFRLKGGKNFILESNHGVELHMVYLLQRWGVNDPLFLLSRDGVSVADLPEARSLTGLRVSMAHGINTVEEINELVEHWLDALHLMTYSYAEGSPELLEKPRVTLYSHAPIGLETVFDAAEKYGLPLDIDITSSPQVLSATVDGVDRCFRNSLIRNTEQLKVLHRTISLLINKYLAKYFDPAHKAELERLLGDIHQETFEARMRDLGNLVSIVQMLLLALDPLDSPLASKDFISVEKNKDKKTLEKIQKTFLYHFLEEVEMALNESNSFNLESVSGKALLLHIFWNRDGDCLSRERELIDFLCHFAHGHKFIPFEKPPNNIHQLNHTYGMPMQPMAVRYSLDGCEVNRFSLVGESDTQFFIGYYLNSDRGSYILPNGAISEWQDLPKHYFTGIIKVSKTSELTSELLKDAEKLEGLFWVPKIRKRIQEEMNLQTCSVILHNPNPVDMCYLDVKNETFSPVLDSFRPLKMPAQKKIERLDAKDEGDTQSVDALRVENLKKEVSALSIQIPERFPIDAQFPDISLKAASSNAAMFSPDKKTKRRSCGSPHRRETLSSSAESAVVIFPAINTEQGNSRMHSKSLGSISDGV